MLLLMPGGSFKKAHTSRAPKGSCSCCLLVLPCKKGPCGLIGLPSHHGKQEKKEIGHSGLTTVCFFPLRWQNGHTPPQAAQPGQVFPGTQLRILQEVFFPLATPICRKKLPRAHMTPRSTPAAPQRGSGSVPSHHGNGHCALPLPSASSQPSRNTKCSCHGWTVWRKQYCTQSRGGLWEKL